MTDIAIFVEDPGAIAFTDGVPEALAKKGYSTRRIGVGDDIKGSLAVVVGTGEDRVWPSVLEVARRNNVPTVALIDSCTSVAHRAVFLHEVPFIAVPDEHTRQIYIGEYRFDPKQIRACGHPRHDALYAMRAERGPPALLFATELSSSCDPLLDQGRRTEDAIERFLRAVDVLPTRPRLVLRLHPKTPRDLYRAYLDEFDDVSEGGPASEAILADDVVIGLTSSILDEAVILGRPILSIASPEERHALAAWRHGLVPAAFDPKDIAEAIRRATPPDPGAVEAAFPRGGARKVARLIHDAIMEQVPTLDGGVRLEPFSSQHLTPRYLGWLNDPETVRYSEQRHTTHSFDSCAAYRENLKSPHKFWAIMAPPFGHVGNVTATVDKWNRTADLAILIGRDAWGRGIGTRAWSMALDWLLGPGGMRRVTAGTMAANLPMLALMRKSGMVEEGRQKGRFLVDGVPVDGVTVAR